MCNVTEAQLRRAQRVTPIVSVQNRYNVTDRSVGDRSSICASRSSLAFLPWAPILDLDRVPVVKEVAERHGATPRQVVLAWLLARSPAMLPIPGTGSVAHLESNVAAVSVELGPEEVAALNER